MKTRNLLAIYCMLLATAALIFGFTTTCILMALAGFALSSSVLWEWATTTDKNERKNQ